LRRLSGWQRIGVVASVLWFFAGYFIGSDDAFNRAGLLAQSSLDSCLHAKAKELGETDPYDMKVYRPCESEHEHDFSKYAEGHWLEGLEFALVPLPIAWLLGWLLIATTRWVSRGFAKGQSETG
jgi:hypothetical protein